MAYEKLEDMLKIALAMQGSAEGLSLDDIGKLLDRSRRTAERVRDALMRAIPQIEEVDTGERRKRWRLPASGLRSLTDVLPEELGALRNAAQQARQSGRDDAAGHLEKLAEKVQAALTQQKRSRIAPDLEARIESEGFACRPGPRQKIAPGVLENLREAIKARRQVRVTYVSAHTEKRSWQTLEPYGFLYGLRNYLVAWNPDLEGYRIFVLAHFEDVKLREQYFTRDPDFSLQKFAERSFGSYQEDPIDCVWKFSPQAAKDARSWTFHPTQSMEEHPDGSLTLRFRAGGRREMAWHLYTWGDGVEVLEPKDFWEKLP